ncbi:stage II sporulation protein D [Haloimpatiens sp. FM7330]|uniref:stage II sporulation protein D n=1 Tax=Haloimpatiens sp. FM7330 TaxID=3298610 RepID=UPI003633E315
MRKRIYVLNYLKFLSSIVLIGMLCIVLFSIIIVGVNDKNKISGKENKEVSKFNDDSKKNIRYKYDGKGPTINVYIHKKDKIEKMYLEDYVKGVVAGEMPANFGLEALKAQSVAVRTFALAHMSKFGGGRCKNAHGADICDTVHCQVYMSKDERIKKWPSKDAKKLWNKIETSVKNTSGQILTYNNELVLAPYYFATSSGKTENSVEVFSRAVPYLKSVSSPGEQNAPKFKSMKNYTYNEFVNAVNNVYPKAKISISNLKSAVKILERTEGGSVKKIKLGNECTSGVNFRKLMNLNSSNFNIVFSSKGVEINCMGYGHGVGMSQWGANAMAKQNKNYKEILLHYYKGTKIKNIDCMFDWK